MAVDRVDRCKIVEEAGKTWVAGKLLTTLTGREKVADHAVFALLLKLVAQRRRRAKMGVRLVC